MIIHWRQRRNSIQAAHNFLATWVIAEYLSGTTTQADGRIIEATISCRLVDSATITCRLVDSSTITCRLVDSKTI